MSHDDILDDMSLSDDEMLDDLADDMLMEMAEEQMQTQEATVAAAVPARAPTVVPSGGNRVAPLADTANMPNIGQMVQQMMPMVSQMLGGSGNGVGNPIFPGMGGAGNRGALQQPVSWEEQVKRHVPATEQSDWLVTIDKDTRLLRAASAAKQLSKPHSRSYRTKAPAPLPNVYMEAGTLLGSMLNEAVRAAHLEHNRAWQELRGNVVSQLTRSGMTSVFQQEFKEQLWQRVANDPDYQAEKNSERYHNITAALAV